MGSRAPGQAHDSFRLGAFLVEPPRNRITGPGGETILQPKVIDLLCALADRPGEVFSRTELIDLVWGVEHGADESLTRAVSLLRKAFEPSAEPVIETIPKRGYRLAISPTPEAPAPQSKQRRLWWIALGLSLLVTGFAAWWLLSPTQRKSSERTGIVVTVEASADLTDELAAGLAHSPLVRVRTRPAPPEPGTLDYRLAGEIRRDGDRLRLDARLLDGATGELVWSERFDRPANARAELVELVSSELLLPLLRSAKAKIARRPPLDLAPWELILLVTWVPGDEVRPSGPPSEESYWLQRRALELDPDFAPAHALFAELASYHALFHPPSDTPEARARARRHADRALELAPYDSEVLYQVALYYRFSGDRDRAAATLDRVLELQPNHPLARIDRDFVAGQCRLDSDARIARLTEAAQALPPSSPTRWIALSHLSSLRLGRGEFAEAREAALASRRIIPMTWTAISLAAADAELGNADEARAALAQHRREWPNLDLAWFADHVTSRWCLGGPRTPQVQASFRRLATLR